MNSQYVHAVSSELARVQELLNEFAQAHPKIASRLRHGSDGGSDPQVRRLVQSFAFLSARTQQRLQDEFPQILQPLIHLASTPYLKSVPSLTTVEFAVSPEQPPELEGTCVERGTLLDSELIDGVPCRFRTAKETVLWPVELTDARLLHPPFPNLAGQSSSAGCALRLSLRTLTASITFDQLPDLDCLRLFLDAETDAALTLYETLLSSTLGVAIRLEGERPRWLSPDVLQPVGFDPDDRLFDHRAALDCERILFEFFCFVEKFLYVEIHGLREALSQSTETTAEIDIYLGVTSDALPRRLSPDMIRLNCCPAVNLFPMTTEATEAPDRASQITLAADSSNPGAYQLHEVRRLLIRNEDDEQFELPRLHALEQNVESEGAPGYWEPVIDDATVIGSRRDRIAIRFVDARGATVRLPECLVFADAICSNSDLPQQLDHGETGVVLQPQFAAIFECRCVSQPTPARHSPLGSAGWDQISELVPDVLALADGASGAPALRAILGAYLHDQESLGKALIDTIHRLSFRRVTGIVHQSMVCHGLELSITFRRTPQTPSGHYLFSLVLKHFLARFASQNAFLRLRATFEDGKEIGEWPISSGARSVI
ncbi:hypothetical protein Mal4_56030 [Maioricimonas rarisocia]|uniref:Type VI secretion protein, VC_A0110 family n=1 Tax=Maioricimonas rarisocia TaxID=2528026 RepID=A0A517ZFH8_9PLAN|nr:type VI secretion system baseplate subunit TssF [Maioricimonas rarisocia]QDU41238.1 hypothetical protein Mal4_56030 [Maioricimonas rarisocia]